MLKMSISVVRDGLERTTFRTAAADFTSVQYSQFVTYLYVARHFWDTGSCQPGLLSIWFNLSTKINVTTIIDQL